MITLRSDGDIDQAQSKKIGRRITSQAVRQKVPSIALVAAGRLRIFDFYSGFAAGAFGFLIFGHAFDGPDLYGAFSFVV
jgi:hypothetical protein